MTPTSGMTWWEASAVAKSGVWVRREGWLDRWIAYERGLWRLIPVAPATLAQSAPRVVQATDWTPEEFRARDWTTSPMPAPAAKEVDYIIVRVLWEPKDGFALRTSLDIFPIVPPGLPSVVVPGFGEVYLGGGVEPFFWVPAGGGGDAVDLGAAAGWWTMASVDDVFSFSDTLGTPPTVSYRVSYCAHVRQFRAWYPGTSRFTLALTGRWDPMWGMGDSEDPTLRFRVVVELVSGGSVAWVGNVYDARAGFFIPGRGAATGGDFAAAGAVLVSAETVVGPAGIGGEELALLGGEVDIDALDVTFHEP